MSNFLHPAVESVLASGLHVGYTASPEPQDLDVEVDLGAPGIIDQPIMSLLVVLDDVNNGLAGSDVFEPRLGSAKIVSGPTKAPKTPLGPVVRWKLSVQGVAPIYLRVMVRRLAVGYGFGAWARAVRIQGSATPTRDALTVDTSQVAAWLESDDAYPVAWPKPPFAIKAGRARKTSARAGIVPGAALKPKDVEALDYAMLTAGGLAAITSSADLSQEAEVGLAQLAASKKQTVATWDPFDAQRAPMIAAVTNALVRYHGERKPIVELELAIP